MIQRVSVLFALGLFLQVCSLLVGCEQNPFGTVEQNGYPPFIGPASVTPDSVYVDGLTPVEGTYSLSVIISASISHPEGEAAISQVSASITRPGETDPFIQAVLLDDGVQPDAVPGDGIFTGSVPITFVRTQAGIYRVRISAIGGPGLSSNSPDLRLLLRRRNAAPVVFNVVAPDTITLPSAGTIVFRMTAAVSDSDGISDIREVYFRSLTSSNPTFRFDLLDDGDTAPPGGFGLTSGDSIAGDGIFSIRVPLVVGQAQRRTNIFAFQAVDSFGDTSVSVLHSVTVQ